MLNCDKYKFYEKLDIDELKAIHRYHEHEIKLEVHDLYNAKDEIKTLISSLNDNDKKKIHTLLFLIQLCAENIIFHEEHIVFIEDTIKNKKWTN